MRTRRQSETATLRGEVAGRQCAGCGSGPGVSETVPGRCRRHEARSEFANAAITFDRSRISEYGGPASGTGADVRKPHFSEA